MLTQIIQKSWSQFDTVAVEEQLRAKRTVLLFLLFLLPALATLVWLVVVTDISVFVSSRWLLLAIFALCELFALLKLANLFDGHKAFVGGSHGRFLTWSAVLIVGPTALWLDILTLILLAIIRRRTLPVRIFTRVGRRWAFVNRLLIILLRDTLPGLLAFTLYRRWGGALPLSFQGLATVLPALYVMGIRIGLTLLPMAVIFGVNDYGRSSSSLLNRGQRLLKFGIAVILFYILQEPFSLLAAGLFQQSSGWTIIAFWGVVYLLSLAAHLLNKTAVHSKHRAKKLYQLEQLAQAILREPAENTNLPNLLQQHVPDIFSDGWIEIRLLPDTVLFAQGNGWIPLANERWVSLLTRRDAAWLVPGLAEAIEMEYGSQALVIPIYRNKEDVAGGIYLMRPIEEDVREWEAFGRSLASQIASGLLRVKQFNDALTSQADAYKKEIYTQAYQAEVYAQALKYEKVTQELASASQIQTTFLPPKLPDIVGWQIAVTLEPAREMSGDFYDIIPLPNGRLGLVIADVADKGMGSALYMALSRTLIRTFATEYDTAPEKVLRAANQRVLADTSSDLFVTVFYAILESETGVLTYCNAGHNPPFLHSANGGGVKNLTRTAIPIGILDETPWEQGTIQIEPGDLLVMYTDGITEAEDEDEDFFGEDRLKAVAKANMSRSAEIIESKVVTAVFDFVGNAPQFDDITLMILARKS
ncbi:MAG: PP2C family protein-serine/threonine phosphatase [Chloroflexi bacterium]|nr:PP2C family protein-serine/threonine phosphatase [Chloroflexota bacterium]